MGDYQQLAYEEPAPDVARIVMDRPDKLNAQGTVMTYELDGPTCGHLRVHLPIPEPAVH